MNLDISLFLQLLINGLLMGGVYVLVASGLTLILGVTRILNLAHGMFYMLGAYVLAFTYGASGMHWMLALLLSMASIAIIGLLSFWLIFRRLLGDFFSNMCASIGLALILRRSVIIIFGERDIFVMPILKGTLSIGGLLLPYDKILFLSIGLLVMIGLYYFLNSKVGMAMIATSLNSEAASLQGINPMVIFSIAMILGCALAGIAGGLAAPVFGVNTALSDIIIMILLVVWLAGYASINGAVIIGLLLGLIRSFGFQFLGSRYLIALFVIVGIIIYFKPGGLFGEPFE